MTVKELKEKLKDIPDDIIVVVDGYEGGQQDIKKIEIKDLVLNANKCEYCGPHSVLEEYYDDITDQTIVKALYIE